MPPSLPPIDRQPSWVPLSFDLSAERFSDGNPESMS
jgi:hypothetical protein